MTQQLDELRRVTAAWHTARDVRDDTRRVLHDAIDNARQAYETWAQTVRAAMETGVPRKDIAAAAQVTTARLYQL
jgi:hypothetical protein